MEQSIGIAIFVIVITIVYILFYYGSKRTIVIWIDESGSIPPRFREKIDTFIQSKRDSYDEIWIGKFDAQVISYQTYDQYFNNPISSYSVGGTLFKPIFDYMDRLEKKPNTCIIFTDGYNFDGMLEPPKKIDIVWVNFAEFNSVQPQSFGKQLILE